MPGTQRITVLLIMGVHTRARCVFVMRNAAWRSKKRSKARARST
jgi:hypothetical protein